LRVVPIASLVIILFLNIMKCFLSHSSQDKESFVDVVAAKLADAIGEESVVYDSFSFEAGLKSIEEIFRALDQTSLFVIFLSESSLKSKWVKDEMQGAKERLSSGVERIYPILIDASLTHDDKRIPKWMRKESYNLRPILNPIVATEAILRRRQAIIDKRFPDVALMRKCIGRNDLIDQFETRRFTPEGIPTCVIFSGMEGIGRRTLLNECFKKSALISDYYNFPRISLNSGQSIEDFILKVYALGLSPERDLGELMHMSVERKVEMAVSVLHSLYELNEKLMIIDEECIVSFDDGSGKNISSWFLQILSNLEIRKKGFISLVSKQTLKLTSYDRKQFGVYSMNVPGFSPGDKIKLFYHLTSLELEQDDTNFFLDILDGDPGQIVYATELIREHGAARVRREQRFLSEIRDYNAKRVQTILARHEHDEKKGHVLILLAEIGFISYKLLNEITNNDVEVLGIIDEFIASYICEEDGRDREFVRLNSSVREYIRRTKYGVRILKEYEDRLEKHVSEFIETLSPELKDVSDYLYSLRNFLESEKPLTTNVRRYIIPSHYLQTIKHQYEKRKHESVVQLSDRVLEGQSYLDDNLIHEIRFYLCSSLARIGNDRFFDEVKHIKREMVRQFLKGFYWRKQGKPDMAIPPLIEVLDGKDPYLSSRAGRELVEVYKDLDRYDDALQLSQNNYEKRYGRTNPHHIQAYFTCLVDAEQTQERRKLINRLLKDLESINSSLAKEIYGNARAKVCAVWDNDIPQAIYQIDKNIDEFKDSIYPQLTKFDICFQSNHNDGMEQALKFLRTIKQKHKSIQKAECRFDAKMGNLDSAIARLYSEFKNYPDSYKESFKAKLEQIYQNAGY